VTDEPNEQEMKLFDQRLNERLAPIKEILEDLIAEATGIGYGGVASDLEEILELVERQA
jgi:hypothetical protein